MTVHGIIPAVVDSPVFALNRSPADGHVSFSPGGLAGGIMDGVNENHDSTAVNSGDSPTVTGQSLPADMPPVRPVEPDAEACCGEGCVRCVFDIYEEKLERYEAARVAWQSRQP